MKAVILARVPTKRQEIEVAREFVFQESADKKNRKSLMKISKDYKER